MSDQIEFSILSSDFISSRFGHPGLAQGSRCSPWAHKSPRLADCRLRRINAPRRSAHPWADCRNLTPTSSDTVRNIKSRFLHMTRQGLLLPKLSQGFLEALTSRGNKLLIGAVDLSCPAAGAKKDNLWAIKRNAVLGSVRTHQKLAWPTI